MQYRCSALYVRFYCSRTLPLSLLNINAVIAKQLLLLELLLFLLSLYSKILIIRMFDQPNARLHKTYKERSNNQMLDEIDLDNNQVLLHNS